MPPRIVPILNRLRQDIAADLATDTIEEACRQTNHSWRKRLLDPATTVSLFLPQILHGNTACQHVAHFGGWSFTDSASCQARERRVGSQKVVACHRPQLPCFPGQYADNRETFPLISELIE